MIYARSQGQGGLTGIREAVRFLKRHRIIICLLTVLFAGIAWTIASVTVPRFEATAAVTLNVGKVRIVDSEVVSRLPLESSTLRSEIDVMRSRFLNDEVVVKLGLASDPAVRRDGQADGSGDEPNSRRSRRRGRGCTQEGDAADPILRGDGDAIGRRVSLRCAAHSAAARSGRQPLDL